MSAPDPLFSVADQIVVVSGGSRGIGRALAEGFVQRGATVYLTGRDPQTLQVAAEQIRQDSGRVRALPCDVRDGDAVSHFTAQVMRDTGRVDTLINVAGVNRRKPALQVTVDDYDFVMDTNLKGAFLLSQAIGQHMVQRGRGSQINIASLNTDRPLKHVAPYAMSKAALGHMTRALALEWGPQGVRVNAIAPGFILTDLTRQLWSDPTMLAWGRTNTPQQRLGDPQDLVGAAIFLAAPASSFMTGQVLYVDGGFTAGWSWPIPD